MKGHILDVRPDLRRNRMDIWLATGGRAEVVHDSFRPDFFVRARDGDYSALRRSFEGELGYECAMERRLLGLDESPAEVMRFTPPGPVNAVRLARSADSLGSYGKYDFYDVDVDLGQRYLLEHGLFPMALAERANGGWRLLDDQSAVDYPMPPLRIARLSVSVRQAGPFPTMEDELAGARLEPVPFPSEDGSPTSARGISTADWRPLETAGSQGGASGGNIRGAASAPGARGAAGGGGAVELSGSEDAVLEGISDAMASIDPDVVLTESGDSFDIPYLRMRADNAGIPLRLGRTAGAPAKSMKARSYFSYGQMYYKPAGHDMPGRIHLDESSSFVHGAGGIEGLVDLSRISGIPAQKQARTSPGTAINAMQVNWALGRGRLVMWKKNVPEAFKTMRELLNADRGGFIFEPRVGIHESVLELDFVSMYPSIMVVHNLSPETLECPCCPGSARRVPGLGYRVCEKRSGLLPQILAPIIARRIALKRLRKRQGDSYDMRASVLKWLLVTCFGYTGYRNARFGRIECHESISAYGREALLDAAHLAESKGFEVLHGIVDSLWVTGPLQKKDELVAEVSARTGLRLGVEGVYKWLVFLPSRVDGIGALNRYYGAFESGELKVRGVYLRRHDAPPIVKRLQEGMLAVLSRAGSAAEFRELLPEAVEVYRAARERVRSGSVPPEELVVSRRVRMGASDYSVMTEAAAALVQLRDSGVAVHPGEKVRYVVRDAASKDPARKVAPFHRGRMMEGAGTASAASPQPPSECWLGEDSPASYDAHAYEEWLVKGAENLVGMFGYDAETLRAMK